MVSRRQSALAPKHELAGYAAEMLQSLQRMSEASGMPLLAHLVDLARAEAERNAQPYGMSKTVGN